MIQKAQLLKITLFVALFLMSMFFNYSHNQELIVESAGPIKENVNPAEHHSTVFVHGTLFFFSWLVRLFEYPLGLTPAASQANRYILGRIPYMLHQAAPDIFPLNKFYLWGWDGALSFEARKNASHELYHSLKTLGGQKTIIGQSHGCNVILNLAKIAQQHRDKDFTIDRLILLTGPVQKVNSHLVASPAFKKVFSLYSSKDLLQILDPQALYQETKKLKTDTKFFSEQLFEPAENLVQAEILINDKSPSHLDFLLEKFIRHLPDIIELLDNATKNSNEYEKFHYKINIPLMGKPYFIT